MCGIVGYVGGRRAVDIMLEGLESLEYRGYDSAGVAVFENGKLNVYKEKDRLTNLAKAIKENPCNGTLGIVHTRWATHGEPSKINSHHIRTLPAVSPLFITALLKIIKSFALSFTPRATPSFPKRIQRLSPCLLTTSMKVICLKP